MHDIHRKMCSLLSRLVAEAREEGVGGNVKQATIGEAEDLLAGLGQVMLCPNHAPHAIYGICEGCDKGNDFEYLLVLHQEGETSRYLCQVCWKTATLGNAFCISCPIMPKAKGVQVGSVNAGKKLMDYDDYLEHMHLKVKSGDPF